MKRITLSVFRRLLTSGRKLVPPLIVLVSGIVFQNLVAFMPWLVERFYSRTIYPSVVGTLSLPSRGFSFSVGEVGLCLILLIVCACVVSFCVGLARRRGVRRSWVLGWLRYSTWVAAGLLWCFLFAFGLNYQRPLLFELLNYEQRKSEPKEIESLGRMLVESINRTYDESHAVGRPLPDREEIIEQLKQTYDSTPVLRILPRHEFAPPKPVYLSEVLTRLGISGIYSPFTAEPNYNADIPDFQLPFTIAHEMAHQRGIARESEANFVAYVVCVNSSDPFIRYSGYRSGLGVLSELYKVEPEKAKELAKQLGAGFREDSRRAAQFWAKASGAAGALSYRVNDLYLRANRVKAGAEDYSNSTTLIIAYHLHKNSAGTSEASH